MSDLIQIVNTDDEVIGHKLRNEVDFKSDIYRATALWLTNSKGQVLIAQRTLSKDKDPGKWGPAASGTMDKGEIYDQNAAKEAEEELGVSDLVLKKEKKVRLHSPRNYFCQWYSAVTDKGISDFSIQEEEVEQIVWIDVAELVEDMKENEDKYVANMKHAAAQFLANI